MAGRISLVEEYENKDMIVQVKKCLDQTEAAVEASETARDVSIASAAEAHEASTNANSASAQAQTAASTVATYGARLQATEDGVAGNRSSIQTIDGEITDIYNDLTNVVRKVGEAGQVVMNGLELRGTNRTSDTVVGQLNDLIVNAKRLIEEIDSKLNSYAPMVRTTGNQNIFGEKTYMGIGNYGDLTEENAGALRMYAGGAYSKINIVNSRDNLSERPSSDVNYPNISWRDSANQLVTFVFARHQTDGTTALYARVLNANGTEKFVKLAGGDL